MWRDQPEFDNIWAGIGRRWEQHALRLYVDLQREGFGQADIVKFNIVVDPSNHTEETMAGILYSWQLDRAAVGLCQAVAGGLLSVVRSLSVHSSRPLAVAHVPVGAASPNQCRCDG